MQKKLLKTRAETPLLTPDACEKCNADFKECTNKVSVKKRTYYLCCACMGDIRTLLAASHERTILIFMRTKKVF